MEETPMIKTLTLAAMTATLLAATAPAHAGFMNGLSTNGLNPQGLSTNGMTPQGLSTNGMHPQGLTANGLHPQGIATSGATGSGGSVVLGLELPTK